LDYLFLSLLQIYSEIQRKEFQSLFYWITYSYNLKLDDWASAASSFNPYFIGLPILIS